jgi:hypothetical protein
MGDLSPRTPPSQIPPDDRLDSWKEIAAHLSRDVTTVQRWEKRTANDTFRHRQTLAQRWLYRDQCEAVYQG